MNLHNFNFALATDTSSSDGAALNPLRAVSSSDPEAVRGHKCSNYDAGAGD